MNHVLTTAFVPPASATELCRTHSSRRTHLWHLRSNSFGHSGSRRLCRFRAGVCWTLSHSLVGPSAKQLVRSCGRLSLSCPTTYSRGEWTLDSYSSSSALETCFLQSCWGAIHVAAWYGARGNYGGDYKACSELITLRSFDERGKQSQPVPDAADSSYLKI